MVGSKTSNTGLSDILLARLTEGLDSTAQMTQALLQDLRESEADFAAVKTELNLLKENVKGLSEVLRDGGASAIVTRVALIEQNIDTIKKWMDNHVDVHQRAKKDFSDILSQIFDIEKRLSSVEKIILEMQLKDEEQEKQKRDSITREIDINHEKRKADEKVRAERQSTIVKIVGAVVIGIIGLLGGYVMKSCSPENEAARPQSTQIHPITSSGIPSPELRNP